MTRRDENCFLRFLRGTADVQILVPSAATADALFVEDFPAPSVRRGQFFVWNRAFPWKPVIAKNMQGGFYIRYIERAPIVEYDRHPLTLFSRDRGRIFWPKGIDPNGEFTYEKHYRYSYDAERFERWYEAIVDWIKSHARHKGAPENRTYYLPNAWWWYGWYAP